MKTSRHPDSDDLDSRIEEEPKASAWTHFRRLIHRARAGAPQRGRPTMLMEWAAEGSAEAVRDHLRLAKQLPSSALFRVDGLDNCGRNALMWAASGGDAECVKMLMGELRPQSVDDAGQNAMMIAAGAGHEAAARALAPQTNLFAKDAEGRDALALAAFSGRKACALALLELEPRLGALRGANAFGAAVAGYANVELEILRNVARVSDLGRVVECMEILDKFADANQKTAAAARISDDKFGPTRARWEAEILGEELASQKTVLAAARAEAGVIFGGHGIASGHEAHKAVDLGHGAGAAIPQEDACAVGAQPMESQPAANAPAGGKSRSGARRL